MKLIALDETPFCDLSGAESVNTETLMAELERVDRRQTLINTLVERLSGGIYREVADSDEGRVLIPQLVMSVSKEFDDLDEFRNIVRNCDRLFPENLFAARNSKRAADRIKHKFVSLRRENEKKKLRYLVVVECSV